MGKRNLSQAASNAADKFFTAKNEATVESEVKHITNNNNSTIVTNNTINTHDNNINNNTINTHDDNINNNTINTHDDNIDNNAKHTHDDNVDNNAKHTHDDNIDNNAKHTHVTQPTNKSKHYDTRGKRSERYGILLDKQLKEDLQLLCNATNHRSLNDFIVTVLLEYVEEPKNRERLAAYKELLKL